MKKIFNKLKFINIIIFLIVISALNGLDAQVSNLNVFLTTDPNIISDTIAYPIVGMGTGIVYGPEDWTYNSPKLSFYIAINGSQSLFAADISIRYNKDSINLSAEAGNLFNQYYFDTISTSPGIFKINIVSLNSNVTPVAGKFLIKINIGVLKPGYSKILLENTDFRYFDEQHNNQIQIPLTNHNGAVKFYLGDFARSRIILNQGDGDVNFKDASVFFQHYGSTVGDGIYRAKYDIASPGNLNYNEMPVPDGVIDFWDLVMFAIGYSKEGSGLLNNSYQKNEINIMKNNNKVYCSLGTIIRDGNKVRVPVLISGDIKEIHAINVGVAFDKEFFDFSEVQKGELINNENVISAHKLQGNIVYLNSATSRNPGFSNNNEINAGYIDFIEKKRNNGELKISLVSFEALDLNNSLLTSELKYHSQK